MKIFFRNQLAFFLFSLFLTQTVFAQKFVHPGINQTPQDLAWMKSRVLRGDQPWKAAFDRLKAAADTEFVLNPHTHVLRGPYGRPNIGGDDLSRSANMAYNDALVWYITNDRKYADKAIAILNAWAPVLWDFDYNDAKLLAAWTGHLLCNAAELLRYTPSGWQQKDQDQFSRMLMTVYYPLLRYYYPQANGNWDGAIIHTLMAIGIYTDNRKIFDNAVDHFLHAPVNGSIFKYIYPNGQCQESTRDQGHVQLGLGEFAGAAQVAFTQGVDLFSIGQFRIGQGFEYTARFLLGEKPYCYGVISERARILRDDYEYVYRHYAARRIDFPFVKKAADSVRSTASRSVLTAIRAPITTPVNKSKTPLPGQIAYIAGAGAATPIDFPADAITVSPGGSIQNALDAAAGTGRWIIIKKGLHTLPATLKIPSGVTICGEGDSSILFLDPVTGGRENMVNATDDLHDVTIRDLVIEGAAKADPGTDPNSNRSYRGGYNRGGIIFRSTREGQMKNINLLQVTVRNCTYNGVQIIGAANISISRCDFSENGASAIPGPRLVHNLHLSHCSGITIKDCRLDTSPNGSGIAMSNCRGASIVRCEVARNGNYGVLLSECAAVTINNNLIEANDRSGVMIEFLKEGSDQVTVRANQIQYNAGYGLECYGARNTKFAENVYEGNVTGAAQEKISSERMLNME